MICYFQDKLYKYVGQFIKAMLKKINLCFFIIILIVFSLGCINNIVSVDLPKEMNLNKKTTSSINISYESDYPTSQKVTISLSASDSRLGISFNEAGLYQRNLLFVEEVGTNYQNKKSIYFSIIDSSIPPGDYAIILGIMGEKSEESEWVDKTMIVHLTP